MKLLYPLIILSAFSFAEDEYPYFSDANKQLELEQKKISFNLLSTDFTIGGNKIEIDEFFGIIGLTDEQQKLKKTKEKLFSDYNIAYENYLKELNEYELLRKEALIPYSIDSTNFSNRYNSKLSKYNAKKIKYSKFRKQSAWVCGISYFIYIFGHSEEYSFSSKKMPFLIIGAISSYFALKPYPIFNLSDEYVSLVDMPNKYDYLPKQSLPLKPKKPMLEYNYSVETLLNLAESYNRKIYDKLK
jgi:hypothetical protein